MKAFKDFRVDAIQLTGPEIRALKYGEIIKSPGERREYEAKLEALGLKDKNLNVD